MVAFPFHPADGQRFAAGHASVFLVAFAEPFFGFAVSDSLQVGSYILAIF
jgi:hypothetical protein